MNGRILAVTIRDEQDVVAARQRARQLAAMLGFDVQDQTRIATAVSEIARNAFRYGGGGRVEFAIEGKTAPQVLATRVTDTGPGITDLKTILAGQYRSETGMGLGILGARRLMDQFQIESAPGAGTTVWLRKILPRKAPLITSTALAQIGAALVRVAPQSLLEEVQEQNQELLRALDDIRARQEELARVNRELEDTNRGVVALYAELDEKADHLRRADEMKSRFLSNMSHEFRTPLNSMLALSSLLLSRADGPLSPEQDRQVGYIRKAAEDLSELVNDLLDLAKVEAGKTVVHPVDFDVDDLFGALRGMLRPLLVGESVALVFDPPAELPAMWSDESKVSQILRNFISNALKFTERGEVRVSAELSADGTSMVFSVADTGIGIADEDQERIFEEFTQLENPVQRKVRGTGLGLPLTRRLAQLLGGTVSVASKLGVGSTFSATIPLVYHDPAPSARPAAAPAVDTAKSAVLVVEDDPRDALVYESFFRGSPFQVVIARTVREARDMLAAVSPCAVVLDIRLRSEDTWTLLAQLKGGESTRALPVIIATSIADEQKALALGADAYAMKPIDREWLLETVGRLARAAWPRRALVIDDDEASRYMLRALLADLGCALDEADNPVEGLRRAHDGSPDVIFVDLVMPDMSGLDVLERLAADPATSGIPRVVFTSKVVAPEEQRRIDAHALAVVSKGASRDRMRADIARAFDLAGLRGVPGASP